MRKGWLTVARIAGVPVRVHWTVPLAALLLSWFRWAPGLWLGYLLVLLAHELGHALVVRVARMEPVAVEVYPVGGLCHWRGRPTPVQRACIAWGGVWAQLVVLALALAWSAWRGEPGTAFGRDLLRAFVSSNLWLVAVNLLPVPGLDGGEAWALFKHWPRRRTGEPAVAPTTRVSRRRVLRWPGRDDAPSVLAQLRADLPMIDPPPRGAIHVPGVRDVPAPAPDAALQRELAALDALAAADVAIDPEVDAALDRITAAAAENRARTGRKD